MSLEMKEVWEATDLSTDENKKRCVSGTRTFLVYGAAYESAAIAYVRTQLKSTPLLERTYNGMRLKNLKVVGRIDATTWKVQAEYEYNVKQVDENNALPKPQYRWSCSLGTKHITHAKSLVKCVPDGGTAGTAIEFDGKEIKGTDVYAPQVEFSEVHFFRDTQITTAYKRKIQELGGCVNDGAFRGYEKGEVLFLGAEATRNGDGEDDLWQITFKFSVSPNVSSLTIGGINVGAKKGYEYAWVEYGKTAASTGALSPVARHVYVDEVLDYGNFGNLGIGV